MRCRSFHTLLGGILAAGFLILSAIPAHSQDKGVPREKQIADLEKQIVELNQRISELKKNGETVPPIKSATPETLPADWVKSFTWRDIGPANMSGRIVDFAVHGADPTTYWAATASGGLLKTTNNGTTFRHQFDKETTVSLGAVASAPSDPNIVWVGTGEHNPRNSVSYGDGVYKSTDGGTTWTNMGLKKSFQIGDIAIHPTNPDVVYVGSLGRLYGPNEERGLYKTTDGGKTWERILYVDDKTGVLEVKMHPTNPETLLIGTWERARDSFDTNDPAKRWGPGSALYKTTDGGKNFKKITKGLPTSSSLGRMGFDYYLKNPNTVFAIVDCAHIGKGPPRRASATFDLGFMAFELEEGGPRVVRIVGGSAAEKAGLQQGDTVTAVGDKKIQSAAQIQELLRDKKLGDKMRVTVTRAGEPIVIEAVVQERQQPPQGGPGGGRGGEASRPYGATLGGQAENVQNEQGADGHQYGGIYKSTDGGDSWVRINSLNPRPMYFGQVRVDPNDEQNLWVLGVSVHRSTDGGKTFRTFRANAHADHHALWINPRDSRHMVLGCDGGVYVSFDRGTTFDHLNTTAIGQFYHVAIDTRPNYRVYGGLQDNGSWGGPSRTKNATGPINEDWLSIGGGDGFTCRVDPNDPDQIYYTSQNGNFGRRNLRTGEQASIRPGGVGGAGGRGGFGGPGAPGQPAAQPGQPQQPGKPAPAGQAERTRPRFNWNAPFILSHHNSKIYYCAGNFVYKSLDRGNDIRVISPEITLGERGSATALSESPRNPNVLYVGTDDGAVWMTQDGGTNWTNITKNFGLAGPRCVASIEASRYAEGRCYVAFDGHRQDDDNALVYVTEDHGKTWKSIRGNLPWGSTRVLREDIKNQNLLYVGTEFAVFATLNRGDSWTKINNNLPTVAVHELAQHPTTGDIVAATHGRSIWILDVNPLRQMTTEVQKAKAHLYQPNTAYNWRADPTRGRTNRRYIGTNPPRGAQITYSLGQKAEKVSLKVVDVDGKTLRDLRISTEPGLHVVNWDLSRVATRTVAEGATTAATGTGTGTAGRGTRTGGGRTAAAGQGAPGKPAAGQTPPKDSGTQPVAGQPPAAGTAQPPRAGGQQPPVGGGGGFGGRGGIGGGAAVPPGTYRIVLSVDGKEFSQTVRVEADPTAPAGTLAMEEEEEIDR